MTPQDRFDAKITKPDGEDGCWLWTGGVTTAGYGRFMSGSRSWAVHRFAWELYRGPIPEGMLVCHKCDVLTCCNPDHLFIGTQADNMKDMVIKGRSRSSKGERNPSAKLNPHYVSLIKGAPRDIGDTELGLIFGVRRQTIHVIRCGRNWAHVPANPGGWQ